jgi:hypothetical protein
MIIWSAVFFGEGITLRLSLAELSICWIWGHDGLQRLYTALSSGKGHLAVAVTGLW